jgi:hypothetical protein
MATQAAPPPKVTGLKWRVPTWGPTKITRQDLLTPAMICHLSFDQGRGKKGVTRHFSKCSLIKDYFKKLISHNKRANLAPSLVQCQSLPISFPRAVRREIVSYIVTRAHKRPAKMTAFLSRPHYILQATSLWRAVKTRTKPATTTHVEQ